MNLNVQRGVGLAVGILALISGITGLVMGAAQRFAALDTRLGKLESAIRTMNVTTPDERYRQLVKELIAAERSGANYVRRESATAGFMCSQDDKVWSPCPASPNEATGTGSHVFGFSGESFPAGAAADAPAVKVPQ